jgi:hypothetical protein
MTTAEAEPFEGNENRPALPGVFLGNGDVTRRWRLK